MNFHFSEISWQNIQKLYGLDRNFARIKTAPSTHSQPSTSSAADDHDYFRRQPSCSSSAIFDGPHSPNCMPKATSKSNRFIALKQEMETTQKSDHIEAEMVVLSKWVHLFYINRFFVSMEIPFFANAAVVFLVVTQIGTIICNCQTLVKKMPRKMVARQQPTICLKFKWIWILNHFFIYKFL